MATGIEPSTGTQRRQAPWNTAEVSLKNLPLPHVSLNIPILPSEWRDGAQWPPNRVVHRQARLELYRDLHLGDFSHFFDNPTRVPISFNFIRRFVATLSELLLAERPRIEPEPYPDDRSNRRVDRQLYDTADQALTNAMRDGLAWIVATVENGQLYLMSPSAGNFHEIEGGGYISATPYVAPERRDGDDDLPNRLRVVIIDPDGRTWRQTATWAGARTALGHTTSVVGSISDLSTPELIGRSIVTRAPRSPVTPEGWGTSMLDDLIPLAASYAARMSSMSRILDSHEHPMVAWWANEADLNLLAPVDTPPSRRSMEVAAGAVSWRDHDINIVPSAVQRIEYLTWDGELQASSAYLDRLDTLMRFASNVPAILESAGGVPSGVALRRLLLSLYGSLKAIQYRLRDALDEALVELAFPDSEVIWENILDTLDAEEEADHTETPAPMDGAPATEGLDQ